MGDIGSLIVPIIIVAIAAAGALRRVPLFDTFREGAAEGISSLISAAPALIGLVLAVEMLTASGFFEMLSSILSPVLAPLGFPVEAVPLGLIRPVSGSGSYAVLSSMLSRYGPDSETGRIASVMAGSTETTFYAVAVYYGSAGIKKTGCTVPAALFSDFCSIIFAVLSVKYL